ncbi:MAG: hypothetical protein ACRC1R_08730 [Cetobacterium sp.]|uniref:hypothetical protein n=1 Tax=Cetobacterium sp. TaxID=2071632 RepID=UPI003F39F4E7
MRNILNIMKYNIRKNLIRDAVGIGVYIGIILLITSFLGSFIGTMVNFVVVILAIVFGGIVSFFQFTSRLSKENALMFSTPIKSHEYLIAKVFEYIVKSMPFVLVLIFQMMYTNNIYGEVFSFINEPLNIILGLVYLGIMASLVELFFVFIWTKRYIKKYWANILVTFIVAGIIGGAISFILEMSYKFIPYYYLSFSGLKIGALEIVVIVIEIIVYFMLAKKSLDSGIDFN